MNILNFQLIQVQRSQCHFKVYVQGDNGGNWEGKTVGYTVERWEIMEMLLKIPDLHDRPRCWQYSTVPDRLRQPFKYVERQAPFRVRARLCAGTGRGRTRLAGRVSFWGWE